MNSVISFTDFCFLEIEQDYFLEAFHVLIVYHVFLLLSLFCSLTTIDVLFTFTLPYTELLMVAIPLEIVKPQLPDFI